MIIASVLRDPASVGVDEWTAAVEQPYVSSPHEDNACGRLTLAQPDTSPASASSDDWSISIGSVQTNITREWRSIVSNRFKCVPLLEVFIHQKNN